ncbi:MAG: zf-HC2 domain-containing protein [Calditrichaeota bacterium]|nr:zf-HC2 domain-containing protein [Calditrichota bacterium]
MNTCHRYEELFSEYIEGEISRDHKQTLEGHMRQCSVCAQKIGDINGLRQILIALPRVKVSSDFDSLLRARIRLENRKRKTLSGRLMSSEPFRLPAYALSFAVILIALVLVFSKITQTRRGLPTEATNLAVIENSETQPASGLVTIYPIDRTSVNRVMGREHADQWQNATTRAAESDTLKLSPQTYPITRTQARFYQTTF